MSAPRLADVVRILENRYPPGSAESWDAVGLVAGDPQAPVHRVLFAVDPVADVVDEALAWDADLVVTHHPLLLRGVHSVAATTFKGALVHRLVRAGCGLFAAHTNADAANDGVADALAQVLGLVDLAPLVPAVPGAPTGTGRVGRLAEPTTLRGLAQRAADATPATEQGVRFAGDPEARVERVAVVGGSGDGFFDAVRDSGVDAYVTADLRHHPVSELRERAEFEGVRDGRPATPYLVDLAHFASEWPWLDAAARALEADLGAQGTTVETRVSVRRTDPWTGRVARRD
ncbi:Nif3-like dinuclear metal center hexameric protein [Cellulomonas composti]|uniref:Nif3-like dinuclear metal center hexameric protein n=1 Tax=Cellulomonas composti TaxID=266130 RepID=UPI001FE35FD1|nr:Nif3-like dinuclear metal center hexameric protein [Cellulomonas composti]